MAISLPLHGTGFLLPPVSLCLVMAAVLCFFAAAYSIRLFRFNQKAPLWHFWATAAGIILFLGLVLSLSLFTEAGYSEGELSLSRLATAIFVEIFFDGGDGLGSDYLCCESGFGCG